MPDTLVHEAPPRRGSNSVSRRSTDALAIARRNAGLLVALLYLQDILWLIVSRLHLTLYNPMYQVSRFEWSLFTLFILITMSLAAFGMATARLMRPLRKVTVPRAAIPAVILLAILLNLLTLALLASNARYVSGGLTGSAGVLYGTAKAMSLASMILLIHAQKRGRPLLKMWLFAFMGSLALTIDGLAAALTIGMFTFVILDIRIHRPGRALALVAVAGCLLWVGFNSKFEYIPDYLTAEFMIRWVVSRFSIQAEQMYTFLAGDSMIGESISYLDLVFRAISDRFDLVMGRPLSLEYPRNVAEATHYDMKGTFGAGSSPGALLGTAHQGAFFFLPPMVFAFIFVQFFSGIPEKASLLQLFSYSFIFKTLHANFSEYLTIISPTLLVVAIFLLACLIKPREEPKSRTRSKEVLN